MDEEKQGGGPPDSGPPPVETPSSHNDGVHEDAFVYSPPKPAVPPVSSSVTVIPAGGPVKPPPPTPPSLFDDDDDDDEGMLRMSFLEHLEELRSRIIRILAGLGVAFVFSLLFAGKLWDIVSEPAITALKHLHVEPPRLAMITPMEGFSIIWVKLPLLCSVFLASPWILYQVWAFISPGLYKKERRWATPFIFCTAGLFIGGGLFAYFLAFRFGLEFLLGIGMMNNVQPVVTITEYFDLFVNVTLGVGIVFQMPVLIFFLTVLRLASPRFLIKHSRYAILAIVIIAAIVTPTPDVFNLMLFAVPMTLLYFVGVFAGYLMVLRREGKTLPWGKIFLVILGVLVIAGAGVAAAVLRFGFHLITHWPFLTK
ncbi:MAG: twin-arginine translocase subunit TatC [Acidobacteriota bacterium]|nr:twin-arginine translocase subunit TatC [Acidobacteriota bacterium]